MWKAIFTMLLATVIISIGNGFLSKSMKELSQIELLGSFWSNVFCYLGAVVRNPLFIVGGLCHAAFFGLMLAALSWGDLSVVFPIGAFSYIFTALMAKFYLHEDVNFLRWVGTFVIIAGVFILLIGEARDEIARNKDKEDNSTFLENS
ncbi:MAG: DMT family transporter [Planctomycetes bacterium]|jgi:drug/metabolite transporter (DMT)-like permease|nr:DMT family transporter [Planctomycetota bacterium]HPY75539.1 DMT family transporter [Planctomycetota bacterium]